MLVLRRFPGERIVIGEDGYVDVLSVKGDEVQLNTRYAGVEKVLDLCLNASATLEPDVEVAVLEVRCTLVKLGITAPKSVSVDRLEVWERKRRGESMLGRDG